MKFLGQYIQNFIARFRSDVYLEDVASGTIASGGNLGLDSNNKIVKANVPADGDITSVVAGTGLSGGGTSGDVTLNVETLNQDTTGTAAGLSSTLAVSSGGTGAVSLTNNAVLTGSTQAAITAESTLSYTSETLTIGAGDTGEAIIIRKASSGAGGDLTIKAGDSAASGTSLGGDLSLYGGASCGTAGGGQIKFFSTPGGTESSGVVGTHVEIAALNSGGSLQIDGGLTVGSTSFVNSSGVVQVATQGTIDHDSLANFVTAEHVDWAGASAGTIHSSNIPTLNQNTTGNAATADALTSGNKTIQGSITAESSSIPLLTLKRTSTGSDNDGVGTIRFVGNDDADNATRYASINAKIIDASDGAEEGQLNLVVASHDGEEVTGLSLTSGDAEDKVDVTIGSGGTSLTTTAGDLTVGRTLSVVNRIELGDGSSAQTDTSISRSAAGKVVIEGAPIQTTQMSMTHHHFFMNSSSTTVDFFFPYNNLNEASSTSQYYTRTIAPYAGKIVKVIIRPVAAIGTACKLQFHKIADTTATFGTATEEVTSINLNTAQTSVSTAFSSATFDAGDVIGVSLIKSASGTSNIQAVIVWEYTV